MKQGRRPVKSELPRARPQRAGKQSPGTTFRFIPSEQLLSTGNATITYGQNRERIENMAKNAAARRRHDRHVRVSTVINAGRIANSFFAEMAAYFTIAISMGRWRIAGYATNVHAVRE
jgi:hypothetical protein